MADCIFCGQPAGFFRKSHRECKQRHQQGKTKIVALIGTIRAEDSDLRQLQNTIEKIAAASYIDKETLRTLVISGWEKVVEVAFDDGILSAAEEAALNELRQHFSLSQQALDENGAYTKIVQGAVLRDILNGNIPQRMQIDGELPFNLQKTEKLVWVFQGVDYYEEKTRTRYVGGSQGISIRIATGLYYRTGGFKGERVQTPETIHADTGLLGVTNKHIYFAGSAKRFRIAYRRIVAFESFSDGIGVQRDAQTAKLQSFVSGDGWFIYNLITNLARA